MCASKRRLTGLIAVVVGLLVMTDTALCQSKTGDVLGTVTDNSGAVVPGAKVTLEDQQRSFALGTRETNTSGDYLFPQIRPGLYQITVEAEGFRKNTISAIVLNVNQRVRANAVLEVGAVTEIVEVQASALTLDTDPLCTSTGQAQCTTRMRLPLPLPDRSWVKSVVRPPRIPFKD